MKELIIDRFEEGYVVCETPEGQFDALPRKNLPPEAEEGSVLLVQDDGLIYVNTKDAPIVSSTAAPPICTDSKICCASEKNNNSKKDRRSFLRSFFIFHYVVPLLSDGVQSCHGRKRKWPRPQPTQPACRQCG